MRDIFDECVAAQDKSSPPTNVEVGPVGAVSRVTVGHDPWSQQPNVLQGVKRASSLTIECAPIEPAPTWNITKTAAAIGPCNDQTIESMDFATTDHAETNARYVWQPPQDWVPQLIEPFANPAESTIATDEVRPFVSAPIAEPVAKLEKLPRRTRTPGTTSDVSLSAPKLEMEPEVVVDDDEASAQIELTQDGTAAPVPPHERSPKPQGVRRMSRNLEQLLAAGAEQPRLERWTTQLHCRVTQILNTPITGDLDQQRAVKQLVALARYPVDRSRWTPQEKQTYWRIRHAILRRTDVWQPLFAATSMESDHAHDVHQKLRKTATQLREQLDSDENHAAWVNYLRLHQLLADAHPAVAAESTLARLHHSSLESAQRDFLSAPAFRALEIQLRAAISSGVHASQIVDALETYEDKGNSRNAQAAIAVLQRFGTGPHVERYAPTIRAIDTHYRNANFRVAISEELMNRFVPAFHRYSEQVHDKILGADVRGRNSTLTNLSIELVPDRNAIRMALLANGKVDSDTAARKGPVVVFNQAISRFSAGKELVINANGIFLGETATRASTGSRVVGLKTDLDNYPLVGWLVRNMARQQHDDQRPFLRAEVLQRVRRSAAHKFDGEVQRRVAKVEDRMRSQVVQPLRDLNLDPRAVEMRTTEDRAILRTRLAGPLQLGAHTPRPQCRIDNKMSVQIHQSAANNLIQQFELHGRRMTLGELANELSMRFGLQVEIAENRQDTIIEFAKEQPLDVEFENGQINVTVHFAELSNGDERWTDFSVRGFYRADVRRMDVELIRDGSIELITDSLGLRDQIALRGIFTKVFATNQHLDIFRRAIQDQPKLRSLAVTQFTIRDGWIAISVGENSLPAASTRVASRP